MQRGHLRVCASSPLYAYLSHTTACLDRWWGVIQCFAKRLNTQIISTCCYGHYCRACVGRICEGEVDMSDVSWQPLRFRLDHVFVYGTLSHSSWCLAPPYLHCT